MIEHAADIVVQQTKLPHMTPGSHINVLIQDISTDMPPTQLLDNADDEPNTVVPGIYPGELRGLLGSMALA